MTTPEQFNADANTNFALEKSMSGMSLDQRKDALHRFEGDFLRAARENLGNPPIEVEDQGPQAVEEWRQKQIDSLKKNSSTTLGWLTNELNVITARESQDAATWKVGEETKKKTAQLQAAISEQKQILDRLGPDDYAGTQAVKSIKELEDELRLLSKQE